MHLRRLIRYEKEEVERREGMEEQEEGDDEQRGRASGAATPRNETGGTTPMHHASHDQDVGTPGGLGVEKERSSRGRSPLGHSQNVSESEDKKPEPQETEDEDMAEDGELAAEPEGMVADPVEGLVARDGEEQVHETKHEEQMDTS